MRWRVRGASRREAPAEGDRKTYLILTLSRATRRFGIRDLVIGNYISPVSQVLLKINLIFCYQIYY
ncbi:MAG: hypothetical protein ICV78_18365 [Tolypothrix sp. Co-bin9]|nr:hypothetical protein [Tolypothrix sp. Co-bin9]